MDSALNYIGVMLLLSGIFLLTASFGIIRIAEVYIRSGLKTFLAAIVLIVLGVLCVDELRGIIPMPTAPILQEPIEISIIYAPEEGLYMPEAIDRFNSLSQEGLNPVTGEQLGQDEHPIIVTGKSGSSGTIAHRIANAIISPNHANVEKPTLFSPSVSHWLMLVNHWTGKKVFDLEDSPNTALAPVVMAIWKSRLEAIKAKTGRSNIGWAELLQVFNSPNGWGDYDSQIGRKSVYYGHTDPLVSSTALSTLISEFYASFHHYGHTGQLALWHVKDELIQKGVRDIEALIHHYASRTTEFKEYIAKGPDYLDFVALEENDLIYINQGKTEYDPPEKLVALYPKEGTFVHGHPFAIPKADWVSDAQREAAKRFTQFMLSEAIQQQVLEKGFRPANPNIPLAYPIVPELGVDPNEPRTILEVPTPEVISAIQDSWQVVKKQADILLVIDTSGSMSNENKLENAKTAALAFLDKMASQNRIGLISFNDEVRVQEELDAYETIREGIRLKISQLKPSGKTHLYGALSQALDQLQASANQRRMAALVLLSDGVDTISTDPAESLQQIVNTILKRREDRKPVIVLPIAYGSEADIKTLGKIAKASDTRIYSTDPKTIKALFDNIAIYF
jgi:Ca-activated chloride channel family protein